MELEIYQEPQNVLTCPNCGIKLTKKRSTKMQNKNKRFTRDEMDLIMKMRENHIPLSSIAKEVGRTKKSVASAIWRIHNDRRFRELLGYPEPIKSGVY